MPSLRQAAPIASAWLLAHLAVPARAQVTPGDWVRVGTLTAAGTWGTYQGTVAGLDSLTLRVRVDSAGAPRDIPLAEVVSLEQAAGRKRRTLEFLAAGAGLAAAMLSDGGLFGTAAAGGEIQGVGAGSVVGALVGGAGGALLGSKTRRMEWRRVSLRALRPDVLPGTLVRVRTRAGGKHLGEVTAAEPDSIAVRAAGDSAAVWIHRADISRLEWPTGVRRSGREGFLAGSLIGLAVGTVAALSSSCGEDVLGLCPIAELMLVGATTSIGGAVGGGIGLLHQKLTWERVEAWPARSR